MIAKKYLFVLLYKNIINCLVFMYIKIFNVPTEFAKVRKYFNAMLSNLVFQTTIPSEYTMYNEQNLIFKKY